MKKRELRITIENDEIREEFINKLLEELKIDHAKIDIKGKSITITLYGTKDMVNYNWNIIKRLRKEIKYIHALKTPSTIKKYPHRLLQKIAKITFPLDVLEIILKAKGYHARIVNKEFLETNATIDEITKLIKEIEEKIRESKIVTKSSSAKKFLVAASIILQVSINEVRDLGLRLDIFEEDELGFVKMAREWREALQELQDISKEKEIKG